MANLTPLSKTSKANGIEFLKFHNKTKTIWVDRFKKGKTPARLIRSLDTKSLSVARARRDELFEVWLGEGLAVRQRAKPKMVGELWPAFEDIHKSYRLNTYKAAKVAGKRINGFFEKLHPRQINDAGWELYQVHRKSIRGPKVSFSNDRKWLKKFVKYLRAQSPCFYVDEKGNKLDLPVLKDPSPKKKGKGPGRNLSDLEIKALLNSATSEDMRLMILMAFTMFMRSTEITQLVWSRVDFAQRTISLTEDDTKTKQARDVNMSQAVYEYLSGMYQDRAGLAVFPGRFDFNTPISRQGNKREWIATRRAASVKCRFHDLRHSGLTRAVKKTDKYAQICLMGGLSLEELQRTYLHLTFEDTRFVADLVKFGQSGIDQNFKSSQLELGG